MTYEEACIIMQDKDKEESKSLKRIFTARSYRPFNLPFYCFLIAPLNQKRLDQFLHLYSYYSEDWFKAASHFQLEAFCRIVIFKSANGDFGGIPATEFFKLNIISVKLYEE